MNDESRVSQKKEVRNLLTVIFSGILAGFALIGLMLYNYNPSGRYMAKNVLLAPSITKQVYFSDTNPNTGAITKYAFEGVSFSFYDTEKKEMRDVPVQPAIYSQFYDKISNDRSLSTISSEIEMIFNKLTTAKLSLKVHADNNNALITSSKVFLVVDFAEDSGYYRIQLREEGATGTWAYYYHSHIYHEALQLFTKNQ